MNLQEATQAAAQAAELTFFAVRDAHRAACGDHIDPLETLLLEAIVDAQKLRHRLDLIASCAASPRYAIPAPAVAYITRAGAVQHIDGDIYNNDPANLSVVKARANKAGKP